MGKDAKILFGERLRHFRTSQHLSQQKLADMTGIDRSFLSGIECGKRNVSLDNIAALAESLDVEIADFFPKSRGI